MIINKKTENVIKLYEFLKAYEQTKSPTVTHLENEIWYNDALKIQKHKDKMLLAIIDKEQESELFEAFYEAYVMIQREPESLEMMCGNALIEQSQASLYHVLVHQSVKITLDAEKEQLMLYKEVLATEINERIFEYLQNIDEEDLAVLRRKLEEGLVEADDTKEMDDWLEWLRKTYLNQVDVTYKVENKIHFYIRRKNQGFGKSIEAILEDLKKGKEIPPFIADIIGMGDVARKGQKSKDALKRMVADVSGLDQKILFTKPANKEQLLVAKQLERNEAVLVQGPPGTGKTHTIANLIGHFLAEGKNVLVTSHSDKALTVVKGQVSESIRPLCISVLDGSSERKELEKSLDAIQMKRASLEKGELIRRITIYEKNREACIKSIDKLKTELKNLKLNEYTPLKVAGKMYKPLEAAKFIDRHKEECEWLVGPVRQGTSLPLMEDKIQKLYEMRKDFVLEDEIICGWEIEEEALMKPSDFEKDLKLKKEMGAKQSPEWKDYLKQGKENYTEEMLKDFVADFKLAKSFLKEEAKWYLEAVQAGKDEKTKEQWQSLVTDIKELYHLNLTYADELLTYQPVIGTLDPSIKPLDIYSQINQKLQASGKLSRMTLLLNPQMKAVIEASRINGKKPETMAEFEALIHYMVLDEKRALLKGRWERQMVPLGAKAIDEMGQQFELGCQKYAESIAKCLEWYKKKWQPLVIRAMAYGIDMNSILEGEVTALEVASEVNFIKNKAIGCMIELIEDAMDQLEAQKIKERKQYFTQQISAYTRYEKSPTLVGLKMALKTDDLEKYILHYEKIEEVLEKKSIIKERRDLLDKLAFAAPGWAEQLEKPFEEGDLLEPPKEIEMAWLYRQFSEMLDKRHERTVEVIKEEMSEIEKRLYYYTASLVHDKAWLHKMVNFDANRSEAQAIESWKQVMVKLGAGKNKQSERLRQEAKKLMTKCQKAVPVWVMSLNKVAECFNPSENKFDVVIIDEASQADVMALVALYLGKQVLVVGDHEQVSPLAIGEKAEVMERLIQMYLENIPNSYLYSGRFSIYDLARLSGYQPVQLKEHFRCLPEIIGYSNQLAYEGRIEPLRIDDKKSSKNPLVAHYITDGEEDKGINKKEAEYIAEQILACTKDPAYQGKTFGVISLKGDKQAQYIDQQLRKKIDVATYENRRILCGNPAHFQGDERDVIFLSLVESAEKGLKVRLVSFGQDNLYKKRYNVAMSRGRDQVILVHSFDPITQLKEEDIRKGLFDHFSKNKQERKEWMCHPPLADFDDMIRTLLEEAGYDVESHDEKGIAHTGLIVSNDKHRIRIVCDSEKWQEEIALDEELEKQEVLARSGWQFIYVSATAFYRNQKNAKSTLLEEVGALLH